MRPSWPDILADARGISPALRYRMRGDRGLDRHEVSYGRMTLGGYGWRDSTSRVVSWDAGYVAQGIALRGHANDAANGRALEPTMEAPF